VRSAAQPRPAPPIARCSQRAKRRNIRRDSNPYWVKLQGQVISDLNLPWSEARLPQIEDGGDLNEAELQMSVHWAPA
jgi:hypothetical protein